MSKYVVDASVVLHLLREEIALPSSHVLLAPTLLRSQILDELYRSVRGGTLSEDAGLDRLARFATMKIRYLGDKVLRRKAWDVAERLGWASTERAEFIALTQLQADALITLDPSFEAAARELVRTAAIGELSSETV